MSSSCRSCNDFRPFMGSVESQGKAKTVASKTVTPNSAVKQLRLSPEAPNGSCSHHTWKRFPAEKARPWRSGAFASVCSCCKTIWMVFVATMFLWVSIYQVWVLDLLAVMAVLLLVLKVPKRFGAFRLRKWIVDTTLLYLLD